MPCRRKARCYICSSSEKLFYSNMLNDHICPQHFTDLKEYQRITGKHCNKNNKTPEQLQEIKQKYKNGIPPGEIERWILSTDKL